MEVSDCRVPLSGRRLRLLQLDPQRPRAAFAADACESSAAASQWTALHGHFAPLGRL